MKKTILAIFAVAALLFLAFAHYWALRIAPPDLMMGDVYRILFVHVPCAWMALLFFFMNLIGSVGYLLRHRRPWDHFAESTAEVGLLFTGLALCLGSIWGRPTWGVWWTWDPRLTTTALLFILYAGYLLLRKLIIDPDRRAKVAAGVGLLIFLNVPIVYLSVKWWRSLHQMQSSPKTMAPEMVLALRLNAFALLSVALALLLFRMRLARRRAESEEREAQP